jgi:hypothetical protein
MGSQLDPLPLFRVGSRERLLSPSFRNYTLVNPQVGSPRDLGVRHMVSELKVKFDFLL